MATPRTITYALSVLATAIKSKRAEGHDNFHFTAVFTSNGRKGNCIERGDPDNFRQLIKSYIKTEKPDTMRVEFKDGDKSIWGQSFDLKQEVVALQTIQQLQPVQGQMPMNLQGLFGGLNGLNGNDALGAINDLFEKKLEDVDRKRAADAAILRIGELERQNKELAKERDELQAQIAAKEKMEHIMGMVGMAFPGLAALLQNTPLEPAVNMLAGTGTASAAKKAEPTDSRGTTLEMIHEYCDTLTNQQLGALQVILMAFEKNPDLIQTTMQQLMQGGHVNA